MTQEDQVVLVVANGHCIHSRGPADENGHHHDYQFNERKQIQNDPEWLKARGLDLPSLTRKGVVVKAVLTGSGLAGLPARDEQSLAPPAGPEGVNEGGGPVKTASEGGDTPRWPYDPASMQGMELPALNALALSIDAGIQPFQTAEAAIAQLSADFAPQSSGQVT